jgi:YidC/Oxa1 family membrane protein insertase
MVIQIIMNKRIDSIDFDELIRQNAGKSAKKMEKLKAQQERMNAYANMNTRNINGASTISGKARLVSSGDTGSNDTTDSGSSSTGSASGGSMMAKANMVRDFNNKNSK